MLNGTAIRQNGLIQDALQSPFKDGNLGFKKSASGCALAHDEFAVSGHAANAGVIPQVITAGQDADKEDGLRLTRSGVFVDAFFHPIGEVFCAITDGKDGFTGCQKLFANHAFDSLSWPGRLLRFGYVYILSDCCYDVNSHSIKYMRGLENVDS